jgi:hypothetical protein
MDNMAKTSGFLGATPADVAAAKRAIASLKKDLQSYASEFLRYKLFDAAV